jgi:ribosome biogenesis GTPase A
VVLAVVGEPNVGKSSTLNALLGTHRVAVSSHPGRTKHYQTHYMVPRLMLCDCPGLVFPRLNVSLPMQVGQTVRLGTLWSLWLWSMRLLLKRCLLRVA